MSFELRPFQKQALALLEKPGHLLCVSPTGSGKSLIYERLAQQPGRKMLLVTPLVALARQQHQRLSEEGVAVGLGAGRPSDGPPSGRSGSWIVSPEKIQNDNGWSMLEKWRPNTLIIDECHCLWEWGEGFRPAFTLLPELLKTGWFKRSLWLTATLPMEWRMSLREILRENTENESLHEIGGFALPERLRFHSKRVRWPDRMDALLSFVTRKQDAGIVFVNTREGAERLARILTASGRNAIPYHAGMSSEERLNSERLIRERVPQIIVATSAFGMGMDHRHLRWALIWQAPPTLLSLAQAIGRVGRDPNVDAEATLFWDDEDFRLLEWLIRGSARRKKDLMDVRRYLHSSGCRRKGLTRYFDGEGSEVTAFCACDECRGP